MARTETVKLAVTYRPLADITPYERNARTHPVAQITAIKRSLVEFGWTAPMLIAEGQLIAGHARHRSASELAAEGVAIPGAPIGAGPTIDLSHLPADKRRAYVLADNRLAELASWDIDLLRSELQDLATSGLDTLMVGYTGEEMATLMQGWSVDYSQLDRIAAEATEQLGVIIVRCRRDQTEQVTTLLRAALVNLEDLANVTVGK